MQEFRDPQNNSLVSTSVREIVADRLVQVINFNLLHFIYTLIYSISLVFLRQ